MSTVRSSWGWRIVGLLFAATLINYMDRQALGSAQVYVLAEFVPGEPGQTPDQLEAARNVVWGDINFAFGMAFALFQVLAGFLVDRYSLRAIYLGAILLWSLAGAATGLVPAGAIYALMACRVVLGIGEAFNWPCAVAGVRRVIPRESRGLANGIFHSGASLGAIATPFVFLALVGDDGSRWRLVFLVVGALGAVWAVFWIGTTFGARGRPIDVLPAEDFAEARPFFAVFRTRAFWLCLATGIGVNVCWHFYNQWFPRYLTLVLKFSGREQQWVIAGFYIAADLGSMTAGWTIRALTRGGSSVEAARKRVMTGLGLLTAILSLPAALLPAEQWPPKIGCFYVVAAAAMGGFSIFFSLAQDVAARHTAQVLGVCGCTAWIVISVLSQLMGRQVPLERFPEMFALVGSVPLLAAIVGWAWRTSPEESA